MKIRVLGMTGVCVLALCIAAGAAPKRTKNLKCADAAEVTAMQTTAIQQQLMDAALTCGDTARTNYNAFQTRFGPELRTSDQVLLKMFTRVLGRSSGDKTYNLFKTELAAKAEYRRTQNHDDFCQEANLVAAAALGPNKIGLTEFVSGIPAHDTAGGVNGCSVEIAVTLQGVAAGPNVVPTPNPLRVAKLTPPVPAQPVPAQTVPAQPAPAASAELNTSTSR
jgi:hypothetical protein